MPADPLALVVMLTVCYVVALAGLCIIASYVSAPEKEPKRFLLQLACLMDEVPVQLCCTYEEAKKLGLETSPDLPPAFDDMFSLSEPVGWAVVEFNNRGCPIKRTLVRLFDQDSDLT